MNRTFRTLTLFFAALILLVPTLLVAQDQPMGPPRDGRGPRGDRLMGTITAIGADSLTLETREGATYTVRITPQTRFRKDRAEAKLSDFKKGDLVFVGGQRVDEHTFTARMVGGGGRMGAMSPEEMVKMGLGTRFVIGEVKAIEGTSLTVLRPDGVTQTISVDENTSFRDRSGESVTLADVKIGDHIGARGEVKDGTFVASILRNGVPAFGERPAPGPRAPSEENPKQ